MERRLALSDLFYSGLTDVYSYRLDAAGGEGRGGAESNVAEPYDGNGTGSNGHDGRGHAASDY